MCSTAAWPTSPRDDLRIVLATCEREMNDAHALSWFDDELTASLERNDARRGTGTSAWPLQIVGRTSAERARGRVMPAPATGWRVLERLSGYHRVRACEVEPTVVTFPTRGVQLYVQAVRTRRALLDAELMEFMAAQKGIRQRRRNADRAATDAARLQRLGGIGGNHSGRLSRGYGQVLVEKGCSEWFDSRRLHHSCSRDRSCWRSLDRALDQGPDGKRSASRPRGTWPPTGDRGCSR